MILFNRTVDAIQEASVNLRRDPYLSEGLLRTVRRYRKKFLAAPDDREYRRWNEMAAHLESISGVENDREVGWEEILQTGIKMVKKRRHIKKTVWN